MILDQWDMPVKRKVSIGELERNKTIEKSPSARDWKLWRMLLYWPDAVQQGARRHVNSNTLASDLEVQEAFKYCRI